MNPKPVVLVVCTGNSMRSQLGEAMLRLELGDHIEIHSAGTHPGFVHPLTIRSLHALGIDTTALRSKGIAEFLNRKLDLVITVCDSAHETCPYLPGARKTVHRGYPDPIRRIDADDAQERMNALRDQMRAELRALVIDELSLPVPKPAS
ncbi:arsenate reductase ArsC [candidate division KSB1 bacterium]|nr:arsenate reductase ArsC [candidate division KSB1 bacterium]